MSTIRPALSRSDGRVLEPWSTGICHRTPETTHDSGHALSGSLLWFRAIDLEVLTAAGKGAQEQALRAGDESTGDHQRDFTIIGLSMVTKGAPSACARPMW